MCFESCWLHSYFWPTESLQGAWKKMAVHANDMQAERDLLLAHDVKIKGCNTVL
jgi:hypothetical protein